MKSLINMSIIVDKVYTLYFIQLSSFLRLRSTDGGGSNPAMKSAWKITLCFQLILTSIFDGARCTVMIQPDLLL